MAFSLIGNHGCQMWPVMAQGAMPVRLVEKAEDSFQKELQHFMALPLFHMLKVRHMYLAIHQNVWFTAVILENIYWHVF